MSKEESEFWNNVKKERKEQKKERYKENKEKLNTLGIEYKENYEQKLLIIGNYNFWASTGRFINTRTKQKGFGIEGLIERI